MALQNSQYDALMRYYQRLQFRNKHEQDARIAEAQARIPRLALIDQEIAAIMSLFFLLCSSLYQA